MMRRRSNFLAVACVAAVVGTGCSGSGGAASTSSSSASASATASASTMPMGTQPSGDSVEVSPGGTASAATTATVAATGTGAQLEAPHTEAPAPSPLDSLVGATLTTPDEARRQYIESENLIVECMRDQGWEYAPLDDGTTSAGFPDEPWGSDAFGLKYGYGVVLEYEQHH